MASISWASNTSPSSARVRLRLPGSWGFMKAELIGGLELRGSEFRIAAVTKFIRGFSPEVWGRAEGENGGGGSPTPPLPNRDSVSEILRGVGDVGGAYWGLRGGTRKAAKRWS